jgi:epsilon-lactone hydrolase
MASKESLAVREMYAGWTEAAKRGEQPDADDWGNLTAEPGEVDYIEADADGVPAMWLVPKQSTQDRVIFAIHGGGYIGGSLYSHRKVYAHLAKKAGARALLVTYRHTPAHTHPAQVDDTTRAYQWLQNQGVDPSRIAFVGDSAGGSLVLTTQLRARELGLPLPAASMLISPWVDLELTGESFESNRDKDPFFYKEMCAQLVEMFLNGKDKRDPLANPLYGDFAGFGPMYIHVGDDEQPRDDSFMVEQHARKAGVDVQLDVFPEMQHTFHFAAGRAPEADEAIDRFAAWVRPKLGL